MIVVELRVEILNEIKKAIFDDSNSLEKEKEKEKEKVQ